METNQNWSKFASLFANMVFGSWYLLVGGLLATSLPLVKVIVVLLLGNLLASFLFFLIGNIGFKKRQSTYEIAEPVFGQYGSRYLISILLVFARIGWVAVRAELGGLAISQISGLPNYVGITIFTVLLILATIGTFKKLSFYGFIALLSTILLSVFGLNAVFNNLSISKIFEYFPAKQISLWQGINIVLISKISFGAIVPDFFQKAKSKGDVFWGSFMGFLPAGLVAGTIGAILTITTGTYDLVAILTRLNLPLLGFLFLALSSFAPATLYPTGVGISSIVNKKTEAMRKIGTALAGLIGMSFAFFGIVARLTGFLNLLGIVFAPIFGVVFVEYYFKKNKLKTGKFNLAGLSSWLIGAVVVYLTTNFLPFGVASINGVIISALLYYFQSGL
jgi:cytosine permease